MQEQLETREFPVNDVSRFRKDGFYLLVLGAAVFVLFGFVLQYSASDSREDFRAVIYGARCLLHNCDPYNQNQLFDYYERELGTAAASHFRSHTLTLYVNLPATILLTSPLAMFPFWISSLLWSVITAVTFIVASFLIWDLSSSNAPVAGAALIAISLMSGAIVLGNGNPAGIVVACCIIAVWCFLKDRFTLAGIFCFSVSLALKPHDAGFVWLYFFLAGGRLRKLSIQSLAITGVLSLLAVLWVSRTAPDWFPELRFNMATMSAHGGNNDPGPAGPTSRDRAIEMIVNLQSALSLFNDNPRFYNSVTWLVCGLLVLSWAVGVFWSPPRWTLTLLALAAIAPLTMLMTYHRAYDTRLLMLAIPGCAMLMAERRKVGSAAVLITSLGLIFTGEVPYALFRALVSKILMPIERSSSFSTLFLSREAPIVLLAMAFFYLWVFLSRSSQERDQRRAG